MKTDYCCLTWSQNMPSKNKRLLPYGLILPQRNFETKDRKERVQSVVRELVLGVCRRTTIV